MPILLGIDIGTTTVTALAVDAAVGAILAARTAANPAEITAAADKVRGRSEWDANRMVEAACAGLRQVVEALGSRRSEVAAIGITGQQHGVVVVDRECKPLTPFINWQDRRGEEINPATQQSFVRDALNRLGADAPRRAGCRLAPGYQGLTLFWMQQTGALPAGGTACFIMDYFAARLTGGTPVTDATCAGSSGLLNVAQGDWDDELIAALGLPRSFFPEVKVSGDVAGPLSASAAQAIGRPAGLPVCVGIGDNQASFVGSVADLRDSVLVNVGTGGQVTSFTETLPFDAELEVRPFPRGGWLLVSAGLCGGGSYATLERFFRGVGEQVLGMSAGTPVFDRMNELATRVPAGADGLRCQPFFTGTRARPELRASFSGISAHNFTPAHIVRALLEGMAAAFHAGFERIARLVDHPCRRLVGAGNGLRENPVLTRIVSEAFGMPVRFARHREEAAFGAALVAGVGIGIFTDMAAASTRVQLETDR